MTGRKRGSWDLFKFPLLMFYVIMVLNIAFFSREPGSRDGIDLQLFSTWGKTAQARAYVIENVLMFLPFGILVPACIRPVRSLPVLTLCALICSAGLEFAQFLTKRGHCQVDDVVMNVLGGMLG